MTAATRGGLCRFVSYAEVGGLKPDQNLMCIVVCAVLLPYTNNFKLIEFCHNNLGFDSQLLYASEARPYLKAEFDIVVLFAYPLIGIEIP